MKRLALALGITTVIFAGTTAYFARQLQLERASNTAARAAPPAMKATAAAGPASAQDSSNPVSPGFAYPVTTTAGMGSAPSEEEQKKFVIAQARKFLAKYSDPVQRAKLNSEQKTMMRAWSIGLQRHLGLDDANYDRLMDLLAQQELEMQEATSRCITSPGCDYQIANRDLFEAQRRELAATFGPDMQDQIMDFRLTGGERETVGQLRARLPDSARLSDSKSDELVRALNAENRRVSEERTEGIGMHNGVIWVVMGPDENGERAKRAAEYNRRLRDAASGVLTAEQLAAYELMQEEALEQSRAFAQVN